jgi:predicted dehydrogenase
MKNSAPLRLGYVGAGFLAQKVHLPNFARLTGCRLAALAEIRPQLRQAVADAFGIRETYPDHHTMLPAVDAVAISGDWAGQGEIAIDCLRAGKAVFLEKPMAVSVAQAERVLAAERSGGGRLMVAYMNRYDAGNELARDLVREARVSGELGAMTYARATGFCGDWSSGLDTPVIATDELLPSAPIMKPDWLPERWRMPYLKFLQQYTHNVNLLRWLLDAGDQASVRFVDLDENGERGVVGLTVAGTRCLLETGWHNRHWWDDRTEIQFDEGSISRRLATALLVPGVCCEVETYRLRPVAQHARPRPADGWTGRYRREAEHFVAATLDGTPYRSDAADTRTDVRLFEDIYRVWLSQKGEI